MSETRGVDLAAAERARWSKRYSWLRENPAFETEAFLSGLTPEEFDAVVDARMEQDANWRPASAFGLTRSA